MDARKVLEMGGGTLLVSLPKAWARKNGVTKGSTVAVEELSGTKLMVRPIERAEDEPREVALECPGEELASLSNDVTGAYLLGYDTIRLWGKKPMTREERARLKATLARLIGLEIMDEDSKHITVQFLLEPSAVNPERIVRRMSGILEGMIKDTSEALQKSDERLLSLVAERDDEVDRLYFLLVRTIRTATIRPEIAEAYGLQPVDVLDYRVLASFLESVGDSMAELSKELQGLSLPKPIGREYSSCLELLGQMNSLATQSFLSRRLGRSTETYSKIEDQAARVRGIMAEITKTPQVSPQVLESLRALERASKLLVDVSDLNVTSRLALRGSQST
jgi:phosphate uptake regulator